MQKKILYIPLDDRPCTLRMPVRMAKIAGYEVVCPPIDLLGHFHKAGECSKILDWLENVPGSFDAAVIAMDMPLYGGLVASRRFDENLEVIRFRLKRLNDILSKRKKDFGAIYLFSSLLRATPTYRDESMVLTAQRIIEYSCESYQAAKGDSSAARAAEKLKRKIPASVLEEYMAARLRNFTINKEIIELIESNIVDFLLIGIDDSRTTGFNILEKERLENEVDLRNIGSKVIITPGTDEAACLLFARSIERLSGIYPSFFIIYSNPKGKSVIPRYEDRSYEEIVNKQINACGCSRSSSYKKADILLYINLPPLTQKEAASQKLDLLRIESIEKFVMSMRNKLQHNRFVSLADVYYANGADMILINQVLKDVNFLDFCGYAAWNTAGNSIGSCIAQSVIRFIGKTTQTRWNDEFESARSHLKLLLERFSDDWIYQSEVRQVASVEAFLRGVSAFHLDDSSEYFKELIRNKMKEKVLEFFKNYVIDKTITGTSGSSFKVGLPESILVNLPWDRLFEVDVDIEFPVTAFRAQEAPATEEPRKDRICEENTELPQKIPW